MLLFLEVAHHKVDGSRIKNDLESLEYASESVRILHQEFYSIASIALLSDFLVHLMVLFHLYRKNFTECLGCHEEVTSRCYLCRRSWHKGDSESRIQTGIYCYVV